MMLFRKDNGRTTLIYKNVAASFLLKVLAALVSIVMVPLTLTCLGEYKNGVWLTISSMLIWIDQMDIGLGNGLRNKLATFVAHEDMGEARKAISSTFAMLICIMVPMTLLLSLLVYLTDENYKDQVKEELVSRLKLVASSFEVRFINEIPRSEAGKILYAKLKNK